MEKSSAGLLCVCCIANHRDPKPQERLAAVATSVALYKYCQAQLYTDQTTPAWKCF